MDTRKRSLPLTVLLGFSAMLAAGCPLARKSATGAGSSSAGSPVSSPGGATPDPLPANAGVVTTLAGGTTGFADGTGAAAEFNHPFGVAVDGSGSVYVADVGNDRIREISPAGVVTTLAGSTMGFVDGTGAAAEFNHPYGVAVDSSGVVYVADTGNDRIRKISPAGVVTTLAGGAEGFADGTGSAAEFDHPYGVAVDANGEVYVADTSNNRIRKISPTGVVSTLAGSTLGFADGTGSAAQFWLPRSIAVDSGGNLYVGDCYNNRIRRVSPAGAVTTLAGEYPGYADGMGDFAAFDHPLGVAIDGEGNLFVADSENNTVRIVTPDGNVTTLAGDGTAGLVDGTGKTAEFAGPSGVAVGASESVYVSDFYGDRIRKIQ